MGQVLSNVVRHVLCWGEAYKDDADDDQERPIIDYRLSDANRPLLVKSSTSHIKSFQTIHNSSPSSHLRCGPNESSTSIDLFKPDSHGADTVTLGASHQNKKLFAPNFCNFRVNSIHDVSLHHKPGLKSLFCLSYNDPLELLSDSSTVVEEEEKEEEEEETQVTQSDLEVTSMTLGEKKITCSLHCEPSLESLIGLSSPSLELHSDSTSIVEEEEKQVIFFHSKLVIESGEEERKEENVKERAVKRKKRVKKNKVKAAWMKQYSSLHKILLVGEGDFSFSTCLAVAFGSATNMIATSLNSIGISVGKMLSTPVFFSHLLMCRGSIEN